MKQARVQMFQGEQCVWAGERAKLVQWMARDGITEEEVAAGVGQNHADHTPAMEARGYHTLSWQLSTQIQQQLDLDCIVGPSAWEACPTFPQWVPGFDADLLPPGARPLLLLEAVPETFQYQAVQLAIQSTCWAVVG